ncbi:MAG: DEAD/DEAH box helicase [Bacilli bacterium]|nr:DEAD/DEAH box helicase [Bacilli bacterium]
MDLEILNGKFFISNGNEKKYLCAKEIAQCINTGSFQDAPIENKNSFRCSKIGLNVKPIFTMVESSVEIQLCAIKGANSFEISKNENKFCDYILIEKTVYFLSGTFSLINDYISENHILVEEKISYVDFMNFCKFLKVNDILYEEEVVGVSKNSKEFEKDDNLKADLFEYQKNGSTWLEFMSRNDCGCILADEMGLGKTLQIIALFGKNKKENPQSIYLVIAPISLLENWKREINKFYPSLKVLIHHGRLRTGLYKDLENYDVIVTSYSNLHSDLSMFNMINWDIVVLDEAQNIKNPYSNRSKDAKKIKKRIGIAVTGTPFENHMTDLWSIIDFVIPGYVGTLSQYENMYEDTYEAALQIEKVLSPIMIRRRVKEVAKDLPERIDIPHPILMTEDEASYYEKGRTECNALEKMQDIAIDTIQKLRMFCTHPIVYGAPIDPSLIKEVSNKYSLLCDLVEEIVSNEEKIIIFTSFNKMSELMVSDLKNRFGVPVDSINGSTPIEDRQNKIDSFTNIVGSAILVLNPHAAGAGLNITAANHVIHYNLEWNPAIEDQASARAYRRGQQKTVFVHRLFYANTIDEVINDRIQFKRELSETAVVGNVGSDKDKKDLIRALSLSPIGGKSNV